MYQVILDLVGYRELTIRRLVDDKFSQPGLILVTRLNDSPQLKPIYVYVLQLSVSAGIIPVCVMHLLQFCR